MDQRAFRRIAFSILLCAVSLLAAGAASAAPVFVEFAFPFSYMDLEYGPGLGFARVQDGGFYDSFSDALSGPNGSLQLAGGAFNLLSGPLVDVVPSGGDATYVHDPGGLLSIAFNIALPDNSIHAGTFVAPLGAITIDADHAGGGGTVFGALGAGLFDQKTAKLLGIRPDTLPSSIFLFLDSFSSYPDDVRADKMFGYLDVAAEVPEPASLCLVLAGVSAAWYRRRVS